ncbi:MAG TPA: alternate F1F0 ATPase, F1 subunit alpha [Candidatus Methanoperedens sp.]|nr:alternate F1F0 ATPase, F1 subunit alpha [Candidatus Methanoperedens sp.]
MNRHERELLTVLDDTSAILDSVLEKDRVKLGFKEIGTILSIGWGVARIQGLPNVRSDELVLFPGDRLGIVFNLDPEEVAVVLLDKSENLKAGQEVLRTGRVMDVPVGDALLGRVIDPMGRPLDEKGQIRTPEKRPVEREAPGVMSRAPVSVPLQTGILAVDAMIPVGRGQRELILGDRQTGKTAIALDTMINQQDKGVICVYCATGQQRSSVARVIEDLRKYGALKNCIIVVAGGEDPPGLNFIAPYAATTMAEYFMEQGLDVLIVYDDLTRHARSYRELSLLLRRPPAREAYPGDIFYIHSRLLERSTHLRSGGSLTALPIIETEAQNISAYIPTNLISITDGQIYLSPRLFQQGILPAVDVGKSVSRVGGQTQLPAYRAVAGDLRLFYSQFEELEIFTRFGTRLDEETRRTLVRGSSIREVLKQPQYEPAPVPEQIAVLVAVTDGILDDIPRDEVANAKNIIQKAVLEKLPDLYLRIMSGEKLSSDDRRSLLDMARDALQEKGKGRDGTA